MKSIVFVLLFLALNSCYQNAKAPHRTAIAANDSAVALLRFNKVDSALLLLDKAVAIDSNYFIAYSNKVNIYRQQRNFIKAAETARNLVRIQPENPEAIFGFAFLLERSGKTEEAFEKYQKALSINRMKLETLDRTDRSYPAVQLNYALNLILAHREKEGRRELNEILSTEPNHAVANMLRNKDRNEVLELLTDK